MITEWIKVGIKTDLNPALQKAHNKIIQLYMNAGERDFYIMSRGASFELFKKSLFGIVTLNMIKREISDDYDVIEYENYYHIREKGI